MKVLLVEQLLKLPNRQAVGMDGGGKFFGIHRMQVVERLDPWKDGGKGRRQWRAACPFACASDAGRKRMFFRHENTPFFFG